MRLYFTSAQYLKMSEIFWLCRIVIGSFSKNCETSCSGGVTRCNLSVALRKVEAASTFSPTCNAIFRCETSCKHGVSHEKVFLATCNATPLRCKLQRKLPRVTWPLEWVCTGRTSCHRLFSPYDFWLNNPIIKLEYVEILPRILLKAPYLHFNKI